MIRAVCEVASVVREAVRRKRAFVAVREYGGHHAAIGAGADGPAREELREAAVHREVVDVDFWTALPAAAVVLMVLGRQLAGCVGLRRSEGQQAPRASGRGQCA